MDNSILLKAQKKYDFFETKEEHANNIYLNYNPQKIVRVIDICAGLGSLVKPWYDNGHDITLVELNKDFIPTLQNRFPRATIIQEDYLTYMDDQSYDVYLCNPPFNDANETIYPYFFCKILQSLKSTSICYFICPRMFYVNQTLVKIELEISDKFALIEFVKENKLMPSKYYYDRYGYIELHSDGFRFNKNMIKKMITKKIINSDFIMIDDGIFTINPYFEFRYMANVFDFEKTKCRCGLFKINR